MMVFFKCKFEIISLYRLLFDMKLIEMLFEFLSKVTFTCTVFNWICCGKQCCAGKGEGGGG